MIFDVLEIELKTGLAEVAELVYALGLGPGEATRESSNLSLGTLIKKTVPLLAGLFFY